MSFQETVSEHGLKQTNKLTENTAINANHSRGNSSYRLGAGAHMLGAFEAPLSGLTVDCRWRGMEASIGWRTGPSGQELCVQGSSLLVHANWCVGARE